MLGRTGLKKEPKGLPRALIPLAIGAGCGFGDKLFACVVQLTDLVILLSVIAVLFGYK